LIFYEKKKKGLDLSFSVCEKMSLRRSAPQHPAGSVHIVVAPAVDSTTSLNQSPHALNSTITTTASRLSATGNSITNTTPSSSSTTTISSPPSSTSSSTSSASTVPSSVVVYSGDRTKVLLADGVAVKTLQFRTPTACNVTRDVVSLLLTLRTFTAQITTTT
jgi:hypothetical protein